MADLKNTITAGNARLWSDDLLQFYPNGSSLKYGPNAADVYNTDTYPLIQTFSGTPTNNDDYTITSGNAGQQLYDLAITKANWVTSDNSNSNGSVVQYAKQLDSPINIQLTGEVTGIVNNWSGNNDNIVINTVTDATSDNIANTIVRRDINGSFNATSLIGDLEGNADTASKWETTRTLTTTLSGAVTGTASMNVDGSNNSGITIVTSSSPKLTLSGDCSGNATFTNLANATLNVTVANNSHTHTSANITDATSANTANKIVERDGSGNFSAGTITANLTGTASNADKLDNLNSTQFLRSDANDNKTSGYTRYNDNIQLQFGSGGDVDFFCNGSHMYTDLNSGIGNWYIRDGSTTRYTFNDNGSFTATGNVTAFSDIKLKKDINVISNPLEKINDIRGVQYKRIDTDEIQCGVIAQEVQKVLPEVVISNIDPETGEDMLSVAYGNMVGLLIEGIKELKSEIDDMKKPWYKKLFKNIL